MADARRLVFLPGAAGAASFWEPVSRLVPEPPERHLLSWPGFAGTPSDPGIRRLSDLVGLVAGHLVQPSVLIAQSMGGVVAIMTALAYPERISGLVLTATSGGTDMARFGAAEWRSAYLDRHGESVPLWFVDDRTDLTDNLSQITMPTLLIFGEQDPIVPIAAGVFLRERIPSATLEAIEDGDHQMAVSRAALVAACIRRFIGS